MHKCKVLLCFPRNQPTKTMEVFRPTDHDETTSEITSDIISGLAYEYQTDDERQVRESAEDSSAIITVNGRRFKVQLWEIL